MTLIDPILEKLFKKISVYLKLFEQGRNFFQVAEQALVRVTIQMELVVVLAMGEEVAQDFFMGG